MGQCYQFLFPHKKFTYKAILIYDNCDPYTPFIHRVTKVRTPLPSKLMRSNQPQAKYCMKSDLNRCLINFFDPTSATNLLIVTIQFEFGQEFLIFKLIF